jgi:hypothetical protein
VATDSSECAYTAQVPAGLLGDPEARRAYLLTKVVVLALAAAVTWPLAGVLGPRAWWGYGAFALLLVLITVVVLVAGGSGRRAPDTVPGGGEDERGEPVPGAEPVVLPVEDRLDLHPFAPRDIPHVVEDYLETAHASGLREVRLIHGRGIGVQRERVRAVLSRSALVSSFHDAPPERGGWGATIAFLRDDPRREE